MSRCVIIGGADITDYQRISSYLRKDDFCIFCDSGLRHQTTLGLNPMLIVGDFDSYSRPHTDTETIVLPCEKDDTDTMFAVKEGISRGFQEFLLLGTVGARMDHTLGNISILLYLDSLGKQGMIVDDYSEMSVVSGETAYVDDSYSYFSLLNISGLAEGITIKNAKYPLNDAEITCEYQYGISNEVIKGKVAEITVGKGRVLLVKIRNE